MSLRSNGSYIGPRPAGPTNGIAGVASGIWDLRTAQRQRAAEAWPVAVPPFPTISGLQLWLDASDADTLYNATSGGSLVAADGGVARWEDKSGNGRHATQGTSSSRPLRKTAIIGNLDVLRFDGSDDYLNLLTDFRWWPQGTFFVVLGNASNSNFWYGTDRADEDPQIRLSNSTSSGFWYYASSYKLQDDAGHYDAIGTGSVRTILLNGTAYKSFSNGTLKNSSTLTAAVSANNPTASHTLGAFIAPNSNNSSYASVDIAEIIIYDSALSDANREAVENYLLAKWAIT